MRNNDPDPEIKSKGLLRLEIFSDGVFAIAITLLILEVIQTLHSNGGTRLQDLLLGNWKSFVAFLIGFLTILICWINHHLVLSYVEKADTRLFWINGFVLLIVTFTPFPTAILAEYLEKDSHTAMAVFGFNYFMMSLAAYSLSAYVYNNLATKENNQLLYHHKQLYKYSIIYTLVNFFICFVSVPIAIFLYALMFIVFAFPRTFSERLLNRKAK